MGRRRNYASQLCQTCISLKIHLKNVTNKPDQATMRPDCVSACIVIGARHVRFMEGQMDGQTTHDSFRAQKMLMSNPCVKNS